MTFASALADRLELQTRAELWKSDPVSWVSDRLKEHVWSKQAEIMRAVDVPGSRTAVPSCNGSGKSHIASRIICRFIDINEPGKAFVFTTAPRSQQVRAVLWRYIRKAHRAAGLDGVITQGMIPEWKIDGDLVGFGRKPADVDADTVMGLHDYKVLLVLDEADGINAALWDSLESLMTNDEDCQILAIGNPVDNSSRFARICDGSEPGWNVIRISAFDTPRLTGEYLPAEVPIVTKGWVEDKKTRWGETNPLYIGKVLGRHPDSDEGLIPMSWVLAAHRRWHDWNDAGSHQPAGRTVLGVDVGHSGEDKTVIATRKGDVVMKLESWTRTDTIQTTNLVEARLDQWVQALAVVDGIGVGTGVVDLLRHHGRSHEAFMAGESTKRRDSSGALRFADKRSAAWWNVRELLDPARLPTLALPPDDDLTADLTTPKWEERTGGVIKVEKKIEIKKRLGRSTDSGDAVVQSLFVGSISRTPDEQGAKRRHREPIAYEASANWS